MIRLYYDCNTRRRKLLFRFCLTFIYYLLLTSSSSLLSLLSSLWHEEHHQYYFYSSCDAFSITSLSSSSSSLSRYESATRRNKIRNSLLLFDNAASTKKVIMKSSLLKKQMNGVGVYYDNKRLVVVVLASTTTSNSNDVVSNNNDDDVATTTTTGNFVSSVIYSICGIISCLAWIYTSYVALSYHPDPKFANCSLRHNVLTMMQAYAFPIPIMWTYFDVLRKLTAAKTTKSSTTTSILFKRFNLAVGIASIWLALSTGLFPSKFAFGYDLYTLKHKIIVGIIHGITGLFCLRMGVMKSTNIGGQQHFIRNISDSLFKLGPPKLSSPYNHKNSSAYAIGVIGLLWFTIQPLVSPYPLATIPTILGKRLSRPASAFTFLGAIIAYTLKDKPSALTTDDDSSCKINKKIRKTIRTGLAVGSLLHLLLVALKIIGLDGGGLVLPGNGLWEVYPAMISVPFAASVSFLIYAIISFATMTDDEQEQGE